METNLVWFKPITGGLPEKGWLNTVSQEVVSLNDPSMTYSLGEYVLMTGFEAFLSHAGTALLVLFFIFVMFFALSAVITVFQRWFW